MRNESENLLMGDAWAGGCWNVDEFMKKLCESWWKYQEDTFEILKYFESAGKLFSKFVHTIYLILEHNLIQDSLFTENCLK